MTDSRIKGKVFERWVANQLKPFFPDAKRGMQFRTGEENSDVIGTNWWLECKCYKASNVNPAKYGQWYDKAYDDMVAARDAFHIEDMDVLVVVKLTHQPKTGWRPRGAAHNPPAIEVMGERLIFRDIGIHTDTASYTGETRRGVDLISIPWPIFLSMIEEHYKPYQKGA